MLLMKNEVQMFNFNFSQSLITLSHNPTIIILSTRSNEINFVVIQLASYMKNIYLHLPKVMKS